MFTLSAPSSRTIAHFGGNLTSFLNVVISTICSKTLPQEPIQQTNNNKTPKNSEPAEWPRNKMTGKHTCSFGKRPCSGWARHKPCDPGVGSRHGGRQELRNSLRLAVAPSGALRELLTAVVAGRPCAVRVVVSRAFSPRRRLNAAQLCRRLTW